VVDYMREICGIYLNFAAWNIHNEMFDF